MAKKFLNKKTTNEFGSFNGSFTLPQGKLNGQFSLRIDEFDIDSYKDFRVKNTNVRNLK
jgi:hypothetical protein